MHEDTSTLNAVNIWQAIVVGVFTILVTLASVAIYTGGLVQRVNNLEESKSRVEQKLDSIESRMVTKEDLREIKEDLKELRRIRK